jgi:hypothetical protein
MSTQGTYFEFFTAFKVRRCVFLKKVINSLKLFFKRCVIGALITCTQNTL